MISWEISTLRRKAETGVVKEVKWTAYDSGKSISGSSVLKPKDPNDPTFIDYSDLTKEKVIDWIEEALSAEGLSALQTKFSLEDRPSTLTGLPWEKPIISAPQVEAIQSKRFKNV